MVVWLYCCIVVLLYGCRTAGDAWKQRHLHNRVLFLTLSKRAAGVDVAVKGERKEEGEKEGGREEIGEKTKGGVTTDVETITTSSSSNSNGSNSNNNNSQNNAGGGLDPSLLLSLASQMKRVPAPWSTELPPLLRGESARRREKEEEEAKMKERREREEREREERERREREESRSKANMASRLTEQHKACIVAAAEAEERAKALANAFLSSLKEETAAAVKRAGIVYSSDSDNNNNNNSSSSSSNNSSSNNSKGSVSLCAAAKAKVHAAMARCKALVLDRKKRGEGGEGVTDLLSKARPHLRESATAHTLCCASSRAALAAHVTAGESLSLSLSLSLSPLSLSLLSLSPLSLSLFRFLSIYLALYISVCLQTNVMLWHSQRCDHEQRQRWRLHHHLFNPLSTRRVS